ncbi:N-acetyl-gamma-glutamyl-phosphate reductase [Spirochaetia bacterium]|nr:N-acetyl-gamma-glutamyl-phosphate reductase [Spirochaetia bacterium]
MVCGIIGSTGYAGAELVRILSAHPNVTKLFLSSTSNEGKNITEIYPNFFNVVPALLVDSATAIEKSDCVFAALPHSVGEDFAKKCFDTGKPFIDLSADFRFDGDESTYNAWYDKPYKYKELHENSIYGLCELNRQKIKDAAKAQKGAVIIGNPGCYPTAASLGAMPALVRGIAAAGTIIVDAASGITGGGRGLNRAYHFAECADSVKPYKVGEHRHTPEISRNFQMMEKTTNNTVRPVIFTPHLAPMNRGILSTIYIPLREANPSDSKIAHNAPRPATTEIKERLEKIHSVYCEFYKNEHFVRVLPLGLFASTGAVRHSNFCDISVHIDYSGSTLIVVSAIDNMVKGAAGQAVQNMNIIFGFDESAGLTAAPALF